MTEGQRSAAGPEKAVTTVRAFLTAMEARDLETARSMLASDFAMVFPGGRRMTRPEDLVAWAASRYRRVKKRVERTETTSDEATKSVYVIGTLYGEWPDGSEFDGIRFIDRFVLSDGVIVQQDVWNDLAEHQGGAR
ncbi:MAG: nuclear transport factor 2 family protein [Pseudomonadota bacterium]